MSNSYSAQLDNIVKLLENFRTAVKEDERVQSSRLIMQNDFDRAVNNVFGELKVVSLRLSAFNLDNPR